MRLLKLVQSADMWMFQWAPTTPQTINDERTLLLDRLGPYQIEAPSPGLPWWIVRDTENVQDALQGLFPNWGDMTVEQDDTPPDGDSEPPQTIS